MSPVPASFELERFSVTPVSDETVLLEVGGLLQDVPPRSAPPRLLVEGTRRARREHNALDHEVDGERLRASFVVSAADAETAGFALAVGGLLLDLPAPDPTPGSDRTVALARELNGARRELTRLRARIEADAEVVSGHAAELDAAREEGALRVQEAEQQVGELEVVSRQLETALADERDGAAQREAAAAAGRQALERELEAARGDAEEARRAAAEATRREEDSTAALQALRSELELAQRALEGRDAELARSADRHARAVARPRTAAGATAEHETVDPTVTQPSPEDDGQPDPVTPPTPEREPALDSPPTLGGDALPDPQPTPEAEPVPDPQPTTAYEGDPVPDDGELDTTIVLEPEPEPAQRRDPGPPDDTGPIPLRRSSQRRYVPRSDRDEELGSDAVRVLGPDRPRASSLPPAPDADVGLPAGLTPRTVVIGVMAIAALLILVAILGYVF